MSTRIEQTLLDALKSLSLEGIAQVADFVDFLKTRDDTRAVVQAAGQPTTLGPGFMLSTPTPAPVLAMPPRGTGLLKNFGNRLAAAPKAQKLSQQTLAHSERLQS